MLNEYQSLVDRIANNIVNELTLLDNDPENQDINDSYPVWEDNDLGFEVMARVTQKALMHMEAFSEMRISFDVCKLIVNNSPTFKENAENEEPFFDLCAATLHRDIVIKAKEIKPEWVFEYE